MPVDEGGGGGVKVSDLKGIFAEKELEKRDKDALFDKLDRIEGGLKIIGDMVCDSQGRCRLATKEELATLGQKEKKLEEYHSQELWNEIKERPQAISDLEGVMLKKLKENPDYMKRAAEDETFREQFLKSVCTTKGCRQLLNAQIEEARKKYPEEKQHWMLKEK